MREQLLWYALKYDGDYNKIKKAIEQNEKWEKADYQGKYVTILDAFYPMKLRRLEYAPWVLFYEGDIALAKNDAVGIIGARNASEYGKQMAKKVTMICKERYTIVSGLAKGIDAIAHQTSLDKKSIAIIGCGLDIQYPKENATLYEQMKQQLILSEYPYGSKPLAYHFPWRNRIIAALSDRLIVIEARKKSGTMLTVNEALNLDIPIYCVPYNFFQKEGEGCNQLIAQGAGILLDEEDIKEI